MDSPQHAVPELRQFHRQLRDQLVREIEQRNLDSDQVARASRMLPSGVDALMERSVWPLETALQIAQGIGVDVTPQVSSRERSSGG